MEEDTLSSEGTATKQTAAADQQTKEKAELSQKYKAKGAQNMTLKEYLALKKKKSQTQKPQLPAPVKIILATPFILICCFGVLYIPYMIFQIAVGKPVPIVEKKQDKKKVSYQDLLKKKIEEDESWVK